MVHSRLLAAVCRGGGSQRRGGIRGDGQQRGGIRGGSQQRPGAVLGGGGGGG